MTSIVVAVCEARGIPLEEFFARGRPRKAVVAARREAIAALLAAGFSMVGVARMIRRDVSTVYYWCKIEDRRRRRVRSRAYSFQRYHARPSADHLTEHAPCS